MEQDEAASAAWEVQTDDAEGSARGRRVLEGRPPLVTAKAALATPGGGSTRDSKCLPLTTGCTFVGGAAAMVRTPPTTGS